ncbi:hypothetical protein TI39_contig71g00021 [Zymoseptoria brevis]|uniref:Uncharacterized protein n=1 Tax=Zymoseptoria brevis TaxID=1047168 RepID=A0A0F4GXW5_9PEZI|nr:hypothetical protein TI39_contig71g00021 [Zymoseptoria brevis]
MAAQRQFAEVEGTHREQLSQVKKRSANQDIEIYNFGITNWKLRDQLKEVEKQNAETQTLNLELKEEIDRLKLDLDNRAAEMVALQLRKDVLENECRQRFDEVVRRANEDAEEHEEDIALVRSEYSFEISALCKRETELAEEVKVVKQSAQMKDEAIAGLEDDLRVSQEINEAQCLGIEVLRSRVTLADERLTEGSVTNAALVQEATDRAEEQEEASSTIVLLKRTLASNKESTTKLELTNLELQGQIAQLENDCDLLSAQREQEKLDHGTVCKELSEEIGKQLAEVERWKGKHAAEQETVRKGNEKRGIEQDRVGSLERKLRESKALVKRLRDKQNDKRMRDGEDTQDIAALPAKKICATRTTFMHPDRQS